MKKNIILVLVLMLAGLSACSPAVVFRPTAEPTHISPDILVPLPTEAPTTTPEVFNPLPGDQRAFEAAREFLAKQLSVDPLIITMVEVTPVEWSDSCLGLGGPAESCAQMITPGFLVKVSHAGTIYEIHMDQGGESIRLKP